MIKKQIKQLLLKRGMNINTEKTKTKTTLEGFDFLGWHFKNLPSGKLISMPSKEDYKSIKKQIKAIANNSTYGAETKIKLIGPIVREWRNYHKYCDMSKHNLWHLNHSTWKKLLKQPKMTKKKATKLINHAFPYL